MCCAARLSQRASRLKCGKRREPGKWRTSPSSSISCARSIAMKSLIGCVEWPIVQMRVLRLAAFFLKTKRADAKKRNGHERQNSELRREIAKARAAQNHRAHKRDEIGRRQHGADRVEDCG